MARMPDLLPIGTFAKLSNLSIKQLRYYHEQRLLIPAEVDESTGYRCAGRSCRVDRPAALS